jgi:hypothetical protein
MEPCSLITFPQLPGPGSTAQAAPRAQYHHRVQYYAPQWLCLGHRAKQPHGLPLLPLRGVAYWKCTDCLVGLGLAISFCRTFFSQWHTFESYLICHLSGQCIPYSLHTIPKYCQSDSRARTHCTTCCSPQEQWLRRMLQGQIKTQHQEPQLSRSSSPLSTLYQSVRH